MKKFLGYLLTFMVLTAINACSKEDEPSGYEDTYNGVNVYLNCIESLYDGEALPAYTPDPSAKGVYLAVADNETESHDFIKDLIENSSWDNRSVTIQLGENGELGTLKIVGGSQDLLKQGIYNEVIADIKGYTPYTLHIITSELADNGYGDEIIIKKVGNP